jgi:cyclophilin family peptidyl-prolyl cis-trans isomerase
MANSGKRNTNTSQFFFTLDKADELTNKHTMFGKVVGNTIYSECTFRVKPYSQGYGERAAKKERDMKRNGTGGTMLMIDLMDLTQLDVDENERPVK